MIKKSGMCFVMFRFVALFVIGFLPSTRLYGFKTKILRTCGWKIGSNVRIVSSLKNCRSWEVSIGDNSFLGHEFTLYGNGGVTIGADCDIGPEVAILTGSHEVDMLPNKTAGTGIIRSTSIGRGCWIGARATILPGVTIGDCAIVGAGSVVRENVPEFTLVAGVPAEVRKSLR